MIPDKSVEEIDAQIVANRLRYESDTELMKLANKIHFAIGYGQACDECICRAIAQLDAKKEKQS